MIMYWYCLEKIDFGHSWDFKGYQALALSPYPFSQRVGASKYKTFKVARFLSLGNWWIVLAPVRIFLSMLDMVLQFLSLSFAHAPASYAGYWFFSWLLALNENLEWFIPWPVEND